MSLNDRQPLSIWQSATIGICLALLGCGNNSMTIWSTESKSPNGDWTAEALTLQSSGFGAGAIGTGVYLKKTGSSNAPIHVIGFSNEYAYPAGRTAVKLIWVTNSHLDIIYNQNSKLNFKIAKAGNIEITTHRE